MQYNKIKVGNTYAVVPGGRQPANGTPQSWSSKGKVISKDNLIYWGHRQIAKGIEVELEDVYGNKTTYNARAWNFAEWTPEMDTRFQKKKDDIKIAQEKQQAALDRAAQVKQFFLDVFKDNENVVVATHASRPDHDYIKIPLSTFEVFVEEYQLNQRLVEEFTDL